MYNQKETNIGETSAEFSKQRTNIKFTIEKEQHNSISFLDLTIHHKRTKLEFKIYRKCAQTHIIIPNGSCHPYEHKISGVNYLTNRVLTYPIIKEAKEKENVITRHPA
jgi:tRNA A-37 threonylcarbamoyl transferase component Bud32